MHPPNTLISEFSIFERLDLLVPGIVCIVAVGIGIAPFITRQAVNPFAAAMLLLATLIFGFAEITRRIFTSIAQYTSGRTGWDLTLWVSELGNILFSLAVTLVGCGIGFTVLAVSIVFSKSCASKKD